MAPETLQHTAVHTVAAAKDPDPHIRELRSYLAANVDVYTLDGEHTKAQRFTEQLDALDKLSWKARTIGS